MSGVEVVWGRSLDCRGGGGGGAAVLLLLPRYRDEEADGGSVTCVQWALDIDQLRSLC